MSAFDTTIELLRCIEVTGEFARAGDVGVAVGDAARLLRETASRDGQVFFIGNGASQSIASHMAADFLKNGGMRAMTFSDASLLTCLGNDLGFDRVFAEPLDRLGRPGDVLVAISSSGSSPNVLAGVSSARNKSMNVLTMSGFDSDNQLRRMGDFNFWVPSHHYGDVEVVHGAICHRVLDEFIASED